MREGTRRLGRLLLPLLAILPIEWRAVVETAVLMLFPTGV